MKIMDGKSELLDLIVQTLKYHSRDGYEISQAPKKKIKNYSSPKQHTQRNEIWPNVDVHCKCYII